MTTNTPTKPFHKRIRFDLSYNISLLLNWEDAQAMIDILQRNPLYDVNGKDTSTESYKASSKGMGMGMVDESRIQKDLIEHTRDALAGEVVDAEYRP